MPECTVPAELAPYPGSQLSRAKRDSIQVTCLQTWAPILRPALLNQVPRVPTAAATACLGPADGANGALGCAGLSRGFEAWVFVSIAETKTHWAELAVDASPLDAVRHPRAPGSR